jgi:hypothetical protein
MIIHASNQYHGHPSKTGQTTPKGMCDSNKYTHAHNHQNTMIVLEFINSDNYSHPWNDETQIVVKSVLLITIATTNNKASSVIFQSSDWKQREHTLGRQQN